jgi:hypothetical protein
MAFETPNSLFKKDVDDARRPSNFAFFKIRDREYTYKIALAFIRAPSLQGSSYLRLSCNNAVNSIVSLSLLLASLNNYSILAQIDFVVYRE